MAQEKWFVDGPRVIDVEHVRRLKVGLIGGEITIIGHDDPGARVEVHSVSGKPLAVSIDGDRLEIDHPQIGWDNFLDVFGAFRDRARADVTVMVPHSVALKLGVVRASVLVSRLIGDASISTVTGEVVLDSHRGDAQFNAVSGEVSVRAHVGGISVNTVSGDVTASGEISRFACDSVSGAVFLDMVGFPESVATNSVTGGVTARFEPDVPLRYRISTATGRLQLDDEHITGLRGEYVSSKGAAPGAQAVDFRANSVSGSISVLHGIHA
ncbi:hypothetical protein ACFSBZ_10595 [Amnibacterium flavum]|uniref:Adhesin domain-containing protein n=1 Tax=Amnibacterium flavum TaxID=2173173 RepID=A0A2V1HXD0_9MICO|nr:hypothetical protein [Amnibacterium flavum]PVZ95287.1 hypothetical protein DDQ50_01820 [Amnibacterium flavum]